MKELKILWLAAEGYIEAQELACCLRTPLSIWNAAAFHSLALVGLLALYRLSQQQRYIANKFSTLQLFAICDDVIDSYSVMATNFSTEWALLRLLYSPHATQEAFYEPMIPTKSTFVNNALAISIIGRPWLDSILC
jgi:hypothetical protein